MRRKRKEKGNLFVIFVVATLLLSFLYTNCAPGNSSHESINETQSEESGTPETTETAETSSETESEESESEETINVEGISLNQDTLIFGVGN